VSGFFTIVANNLFVLLPLPSSSVVELDLIVRPYILHKEVLTL